MVQLKPGFVYEFVPTNGGHHDPFIGEVKSLSHSYTQVSPGVWRWEPTGQLGTMEERPFEVDNGEDADLLRKEMGYDEPPEDEIRDPQEFATEVQRVYAIPPEVSLKLLRYQTKEAALKAFHEHLSDASEKDARAFVDARWTGPIDTLDEWYDKWLER